MSIESRPGAFNKYRMVIPGEEDDEHAKAKGARVAEKCPKCGNEEMIFTTAQLRSADEGQTVFYTCVKCAYVIHLPCCRLTSWIDLSRLTTLLFCLGSSSPRTTKVPPPPLSLFFPYFVAICVYLPLFWLSVYFSLRKRERKRKRKHKNIEENTKKKKAIMTGKLKGTLGH